MNIFINGVNNIVGYVWIFSNGNGISDEENLIIMIIGNQIFMVLLMIIIVESCMVSVSQEVIVNLGLIDIQFDDELLVCFGDFV